MEAAIQDNPIRLNLGCGAKILEGWVNVDIVPRGGANYQSVQGGVPDVDADIRELPFEDNYADEAMAIHVLEHFYIWEAPDVLREWVRVLKPGGKLIIEVPDLDKVILHIQNGTNIPNFTLWALYGDPTEKDPLMVHKWCYSAKILGRLLEQAGLNRVERKRAEFHMKEDRDLRMVGYK